MRDRSESFRDYIGRICGKQSDKSTCREITFQITNQCNLRCSYCYEHNKTSGSMSIYTARKCIDTLLKMYKDDNSNFINHKTKGLILDFIGGEPLLEAKLIEDIIQYYLYECYKQNIPLYKMTRISFATNGQSWFTPEAQHLIQKYHDMLSVCISIDGIQELHDKYRIDQYGNGSFEKAYAAFIDARDKYGWNQSKMTFTPGSTKYLFESIKMMIESGCNDIFCNYAFEPTYTTEDANNIYFQLKKLADYLITEQNDIWVSILSQPVGGMCSNDDNWCGGTGEMLAFDVNGNAYPCIRYMPISIGKEKASKMIIGDCYNGLYHTESQITTKNMLSSITRSSQSTKECLECPVQEGCAWCSGYNYEQTGTPNKRVTHICLAHKARVLAVCYYLNKRSLILNDCNPKKINLPKEEVIDIIGTENANELYELEQDAFNRYRG